MIVLRQDQQELKAGIYDAWRSGARNALAVLPTGGGKSIVVTDIIKDGDDQNLKECVIAHRNELVGQMSLHVARRGIRHQLIAPKEIVKQVIAEHRAEFNGQSFISPSAHCSVAGVDTLLARASDLAIWARQIGRWTIDEAHHVLRLNKWGKAAAMFPNAYGLGVTATPQRADGFGLGSHADGIFDRMIVGPSPRELINIGAITDYEYVCPKSDFEIDENDVDNKDKMREASKRSRIVGDVVTEYTKYAFGKRGITFATDIETAGEIAARFNAVGIPAAAISSKTPIDVRGDAIRRFRDGRYWQLINVDLFGEGFDVPAVEVVSMARPTASLAVFLQQAGRALRAMFGKAYGLIIDHVSNYKRHGLPDKERFWTLDRREKRGKKKEKDPDDLELIVCKSCMKPYERPLLACPHCGAVPVVEPGGRGSVEQIDGDLILLDRAKLAELRAATELENPGDIGGRVGMAAGEIAAKGAINRQIERFKSQNRLKDAIALWAGYQRAKGKPDGESYRRFYLALGVDVLSALAAPARDMDRMSEQVEGWIRQ